MAKTKSRKKGTGKKKGTRKKNAQTKRKREAESVDSLPVKNPDAAGIDLGSKLHFVAVPKDRDKESVRTFECYTDDLHRLGKWLVSCGVKTVALEATGVYWIPVIEVLEGCYGLEVVLVHPQYTKNVPGRKTDVKDCQWVQTLHTHGLLPSSFRPDDCICRLRKYWRHRARLVEDASREILRMQKELDEMNLHLHKVISDITGLTGMTIIRAIVAGERDPVTLAKMKDHRVRSSTETIVRALTGNYRQEHLETLSDVLETYDHLQQQIARVDERIERELSTFESKVDPEERPLLKAKSRSSKKWGNEPGFDLRTELYRMTGVDLTPVPGFGASTVMTLVTECGLDMSAWETEKHFTSWLSLSPGSKVTGGKNLSGRTRKNGNRAAKALRLAAFGLQRSDSALGAYFRRMRGRLGPAKAITATARKLAIVYYRAMKYGQVYVDEGAAQYEERFKERTIKFLQKKAKQLGFRLLPDNANDLNVETLESIIQEAQSALDELKNRDAVSADTADA